MKHSLPARVGGALAGLAHALVGGGGGMVFVPMLARWGGLSPRRLYPTCVAVIFPVCAVSAGVYFLRGGLSLMEALPYLLGGGVGGFLGGKLYGKVSTTVLKWLFAAFLFYAGVKYLR